MKHLLYLLTGAILITSCNDKKSEGNGTSELTKKNLASNQIVMDAFVTGDTSKIDEAVAADFIDHTDRGDAGRDSLKKGIVMMHGWDTTMQMKAVKVLADDEHVFAWMEMKGNSDGTLGMPKGPYNMHSIEVTRFKEGKAVEHWSFMEMREVMKMMGMNAAMPMDTTGAKPK